MGLSKKEYYADAKKKPKTFYKTKTNFISRALGGEFGELIVYAKKFSSSKVTCLFSMV